MGLNMSSSLLLKDANSKFDIPLYQNPINEYYYLPSLNIVQEINDDIREVKMELYQLGQMEFVNEANILKTINDTIMRIIHAILLAIDKIRKAIVNAFKAFMANQKKEATSAGFSADDLDNAWKVITENYVNSMYIEMEVYPTKLSDALTNPNIPDSKSLFSNIDFDRIMDNINDIKASSEKVDESAFKSRIEFQKKQMIKDRIRARKELTGIAIDESDINNTTLYREHLTKLYIGEKSSQTITIKMAEDILENLERYKELVDKFAKSKDTMDKQYNELVHRIEVLKVQATTELKHFSEDSIKEPDRMIAELAKGIVVIADSINGFLQDNLLSYTVKMECMNKIHESDKKVIHTIMSLIEKKNKAYSKNESAVIFEEDDRERIHCEMDESLTRYCEECFTLHEMISNSDVHNYIMESVFMEEESKPGFKDTVDRVVEMIITMFKKFMLSLNQLIGLDKKWFEQNEKTLRDPNFKFPDANAPIPDWIQYRFDLLEKSFDIQPFDMTNTSLMDQLKDEETFAKFVFQKMGGSESDIKSDEAKNGSFAVKCKAIYSGGGKTEVKVSQLQNSKDKFLDYCMNYLSGENGGIYKSISADTKKLDESKKNVQRALKNYQPEEKKPETNTDNSNDATKSTTSGGNNEQEKPNGANAQENKEESFGFDLDLAQILGLQENTFMMELTTPDVNKADKAAVNDNISAAGGDTKEGLKEIRDKSNRYFTMMGNALGAKMTISMQCYKQYKQLFKWALKSSTDRKAENADTVKGSEENSESIESAAKSKDNKNENNKK